jgi:hypothetical protein
LHTINTGEQLSRWLTLLREASDVGASPALRRVAVESLVSGGAAVLRDDGASALDGELQASAWLIAARLLEDDDHNVRADAAEFVHRCVPLVDAERADDTRLSPLEALLTHVVARFADTRATALYVAHALLSADVDAQLDLSSLVVPTSSSSSSSSPSFTPPVFATRWSNRLPLFEIESSNGFAEPLQTSQIIIALLQRFVFDYDCFFFFSDKCFAPAPPSLI